MCKSSAEKSQAATLNVFCNWSGGGGGGVVEYLIPTLRLRISQQ